MTFNKIPAECYVYITLPQEIFPITAGKFVLTSNRQGVPLGRFVYGKSYLSRQNAVEIDPGELKLSSQIFETVSLHGLFGALRDASPDYWGRRIIEKHLGKSHLSEMDYLLYSPDDRAGALGFGLSPNPPAPRRLFNKTIHLKKVLKLANDILNDEEILQEPEKNQVEQLMLLGTSMGGARPKAIIEDDEALWIAKFNRPDDRWNNARLEHAMLTLAHNCGINSAQSRVIRVGKNDVLLVKRFDREKTKDGYFRSRMLSALTLLKAEDVLSSRHKWSYILLAEELRKICHEPKKNTSELFRRMCFNALISNLDDHPRNHAVLAKQNEWEISPAYDLTVTVPISVEHRDLAMACGDQGRFANAENLLSQHSRFLLSKEEAQKILSQMQKRVQDTWYSTARTAGLSEKDCEKISGAFIYPGLES